MTQPSPNLLTETQLEALIGQRLKEQRLRRNLNQTELAERAGLARRTITSIENGNGCTLGTLIRIVRALDLEHLLHDLIAPLPPSPLAIREAQRLAEPTRKHASKPRKKTTSPTTWTWGDETP
jgi:transcriptional regulator with XRE-family HTH domain